EIRAEVASTVSSGKLSNEKHFEYMRAMDGAKFLFGSKVNDYLSELDTALAYFHEADEEYGPLQSPRRSAETRSRYVTLTSRQSVALIWLCTEKHRSERGVDRIDVFEKLTFASNGMSVVVFLLPCPNKAPKYLADL